MVTSALVRLVRNSPSLGVFATVLLLQRQGLLKKLPRSLRWFYAFLLVLNWPNLPFIWHLRVLSPSILRSLAFRISGSFGSLIGRQLTDDVGSLRRFPFVGRPVFVDGGTVFSGSVGFAELDFNMHMSNSTYNLLADRSRANLAFTAFAPLLKVQRILVPLAGIQTCFFKEIKLGQRFEVETRTFTYDERWCWALTRITIANRPQRNGKPSRDILVQTLTGERVLCTMMLSRHCFKLPGHAGNPRPARVYSIIGLNSGGNDLTNWKAAKEVLAKGPKAVCDYLMNTDPSVPTGLEGCEKHRAAAHAALQKIGDGGNKAAWMEINHLVTNWVRD